MKDDRVYLGHMLDMARKAVDKTRDLSRAAYDEDENLRLALAHLVQVIGEAARRVSPAGQAAHPEIPRREITGMRHKIVHDYMDLGETITCIQPCNNRCRKGCPGVTRCAFPPRLRPNPCSIAQIKGDVAWHTP